MLSRRSIHLLTVITEFTARDNFSASGTMILNVEYLQGSKCADYFLSALNLLQLPSVCAHQTLHRESPRPYAQLQLPVKSCVWMPSTQTEHVHACSHAPACSHAIWWPDRLFVCPQWLSSRQTAVSCQPCVRSVCDKM